MSSETWDETAFKASIPEAREKVEFAARFIDIGPSQPGWQSHHPVVELIFYLCKLDYDIKVLLFQYLTEPENRSVWERYLTGLCPSPTSRVGWWGSVLGLRSGGITLDGDAVLGI